MLGAVVNELEAQRDKSIDRAFANRMIGWTNDLIGSH